MLNAVQQQPVSHHQGTCLIVEDSKFDSERMTRIIERHHGKLRVQVATTLASARKALERGQMTLILLDNNLPDGLGANFAVELADDPVLSKIPVIIVSDWPSPFMWEKAAAAGVIYALNKSEFDARYVAEALNTRKNRARLRLN